MRRLAESLAWIPFAALVLLLSGCILPPKPVHKTSVDGDLAHCDAYANQIEYPDICASVDQRVNGMPEPITLQSGKPPEVWNLSLQQAIRLALSNSTVLRDLGGLVVQSPDTTRSVFTPALQESDPRFGIDAALAAFDTQFEVATFAENNDRALNNSFFGGGTRVLKQDFLTYYMQLSKKSATGADFTIRHNIDYDANNAPGNQFPSAWNTNIEAEFRQPLMQGAGVDFNRVAGPNSSPGQLRGVLLARTNHDISLADFEVGVRNLVSDVENAYWELYFAYRDLDAKLAARAQALKTWRIINNWKRFNRLGGRLDKEAQAREQYHRLDAEVQTALSGRQIEPVRINTFRGVGGVHANERRLRQIMGVPVNDGRLIRPSDEPQLARVVFNWNEILVESQVRRAELRRQKWVIKRRELELLASKNFLLPRFDAVGRYRFRGFGKDLLDPNGNHKPQFNDAFSDLATGDFQEWQLGFELTVPIGYRQGHAAVRFAELNLAREVAVLEEQQRYVAHDLSAAYAEMKRAYQVAKTAFNRRVAALEQVQALEVRFADAEPNEVAQLIDQLLVAQRGLADAEARYYQSLCEYSVAVKNVHLNKGSLLDYNDVHLAEGAWPAKAYADAAKRDHTRRAPMRLAELLVHKRPPPIISQGPYPQQTVPGTELPYPTADIGPNGPPQGPVQGGTIQGQGLPPQGLPQPPAPLQGLPQPPAPLQDHEGGLPPHQPLSSRPSPMLRQPLPAGDLFDAPSGTRGGGAPIVNPGQLRSR